MATSGIRKLTLADYERIPSDGNRHELICGEEFVTPAPDVGHQRTSLKLVVLLHEHVESGTLGEILSAPTDVVLSDVDIVQPDILFVSRARGGIVGEKNIQGAPDLVVEIVSAATASVDRTLKLGLHAFRGAGVLDCRSRRPLRRGAPLRRDDAPRRGAGGSRARFRRAPRPQAPRRRHPLREPT